MYSAQSPDELALVNAAKQFGMRFRKRPTTKTIEIEQDLPQSPVRGGPASSVRTGPILHQFEILNILEFSSARRRMTVIVKDKQGKIKVLTKGADSIITDLLSEVDMDTNEGARQAQVRQSTKQNLLDHARQGLRTLLIGEKTISEPAYNEWSAKLRQAEAATGQGKARKLEKVYALIENDFDVLGSTALEDNLQDNVPESLQKFKKAGINVWVLTGDKEETAINIGFAAGMITNET